MMTTKTKHHTESLLVLLLFGIFAVCILLVLLTGANTYKTITERNDAAYSERTAAQYISTKVHQADNLDMITVVPFGETMALQLAETVEGETYTTYIYYHDGQIKELYAAADSGLTPEDGWEILPAESLNFSLQNNLLRAEISANGQTTALNINLRSKEAAR